MLGEFALPNKPQEGCIRLAAVRFIAESTDMIPLVSNYPHICCLHNQPSEAECVRQIKPKFNAVRLKNPLPPRTGREPTITLPSRGFGCCTPKTTPSPRHHLWDPPPSQLRLPPVIRPCPPAKRTYCSRVFSLHTFCRAFWCNCHCSGPQPCTGSISSVDSSLFRLHRFNWRCRCLPCPFHRPFHPSHRNHSFLCLRAQAVLTSLQLDKI